ncbi:hypothetical protein ACTXG7_24880 [Mycolicibacterium sp. Dal123E01]|uniref:hypothetical protein n=1 Tax=Mycolicibacterium sp. Dal123E01 TaxID=3457578 RepID=UPI00403E73A1
MTDEFAFEIRPKPGFGNFWYMTTSGYSDEPGYEFLDGDWDTMDSLVDVEATIENVENEYAEKSGATVVRISGSHGLREIEWDNGQVHRYEWELITRDWRCPRCKHPDNRIYMVTDELWASSGFERQECYRCLEEVIGRQLQPADFKPLPCNDPKQANLSGDLLERIVGHAR